jgi:HK97 gp10 family phage protein
MKMAKDVTCEEFSKYLSNIAPNLSSQLEKTIGLCCQKVRSDIQSSMAHTERNMEVSYFTNNKTKAHHPSLPGNPPAPDTGNLRNSIRYEVRSENKEVYGIVGTTQKDPPYGEYLEYGTKKMKPRPWLRPAMKNNEEWIRKNISNTVIKALRGAIE